MPESFECEVHRYYKKARYINILTFTFIAKSAMNSELAVLFSDSVYDLQDVKYVGCTGVR